MRQTVFVCSIGASWFGEFGEFGEFAGEFDFGKLTVPKPYAMQVLAVPVSLVSLIAPNFYI